MDQIKFCSKIVYPANKITDIFFLVPIIAIIKQFELKHTNAKK